MKIAFTGAQGTGKTTLLNMLKHQPNIQYKYEFIDEITRRMLKKGLQINEQGDNTTQLLIVNEHIKNTLYTDCVLDRCILDGFVYTTWLYDNNKVKGWVYQYSKQVFYHYKDSYDYIFYIKPEFDIENDGVRSNNIRFRDEISALFETYIHEINVPIITLTGTAEERIKTINDTVKW